MNLIPCPRVVRRVAGFFPLPGRIPLWFEPDDPDARPAADRLTEGARHLGVRVNMLRQPPGLAFAGPRILFRRDRRLRRQQAYMLQIGVNGIDVEYADAGGAHAAVATLRQLFREYRRQLPRVRIRDWPDFPRRGVMLDISRGRVPRLETLLELVEHLADFKFNEFQLYIEHTFAYRGYRSVWNSWGALTGREIRLLDQHCRNLGVDLVPNQNSFGHLRQWLEHPSLRRLGEVQEPYEHSPGGFLRRPSTLSPTHPGSIRLLRRLFDELLPHFTSRRFNVGCDETWDLGRGQSRALCKRLGQGRAYLGFLKKIHREVAGRGRRMMFWGDIILNYPELLAELPRDSIALNWGYEADHPFEREAPAFARAGLDFYVCPGTSTWMTLIGRHDNALANLRAAARAGLRHGATGYLVADWGDGGHPQPLAVSYLPYLAGAALSWCGATFRSAALVPALNRDVFKDPTHRMAAAAWNLGTAHRLFGFTEPNATPFGTVVTAPPPELRELFCLNGLTHYRRIRPRRIDAAMRKVQGQLRNLLRARPAGRLGRILKAELILAARMAVESCRYMLWQQSKAARDNRTAARLASEGDRQLRRLDREFTRLWPARNKGTPRHSSPFLGWRLSDYRSDPAADVQKV